MATGTDIFSEALLDAARGFGRCRWPLTGGTDHRLRASRQRTSAGPSPVVSALDVLAVLAVDLDHGFYRVDGVQRGARSGDSPGAEWSVSRPCPRTLRATPERCGPAHGASAVNR